AARTTDRIQLVDENDRRRVLAGFAEQVAHAGGPDAHDHLHELRAAHREERHTRFPGHRLREQGLAGARRADQQHAFRRGAAEPGVLLRLFQEVDDLGELVLGLVDARHVVEGDARVRRLVEAPRLALAQPHQAAAALRRGAAEQPEVEGDQQEGGAETEQQDVERAVARLDRLRADLDALPDQQRFEPRVEKERQDGRSEERRVGNDGLSLWRIYELNNIVYNELL